MSLPQSQSTGPIEPGGRIANWRERFEARLAAILPGKDEQPAQLHRAMRYAILDGGKRIRPMLVYAAGSALNLREDLLDSVAASIEIIHAYSLIHDDLPAMDDDDLRRGRPSVHRAFDEATAILAGDALQALAFRVLSEDSKIESSKRLEIVTALARACGSMGMAGGQMLDLEAVGTTLSPDALEAMHRLKTGALIELCLTAPTTIAQVGEPVRHALTEYGACVGLAFQIHDDILDVIGESKTMGKPTLADVEKGKPTFPAVIGLKRSQDRARELRDQALATLKTCPGDCSVLEYLAEYVIGRDR